MNDLEFQKEAQGEGKSGFGTESSLWEVSEIPGKCRGLPVNSDAFIIWLFTNQGLL